MQNFNSYEESCNSPTTSKKLLQNQKYKKENYKNNNENVPVTGLSHSYIYPEWWGHREHVPSNPSKRGINLSSGLYKALENKCVKSNQLNLSKLEESDQKLINEINEVYVSNYYPFTKRMIDESTQTKVKKNNDFLEKTPNINQPDLKPTENLSLNTNISADEEQKLNFFNYNEDNIKTDKVITRIIATKNKKDNEKEIYQKNKKDNEKELHQKHRKDNKKEFYQINKKKHLIEDFKLNNSNLEKIETKEKKQKKKGISNNPNSKKSVINIAREFLQSDFINCLDDT
ncbi:hypothetical protein HK099_003825 [Clydaea vesicula]|uniref:Uncharacterized protein n=1 Tax=Clydaea vesicula TaxID=447962 RepID=A0AAD5U1I0_9FUNG|nr:hypothetical protein HK099_003825 [Clydaea vesicula]